MLFAGDVRPFFQDYVAVFGDKPCAFLDLKPFIHNLPVDQVEEFLTYVEKSVGLEQDQSPTSVNIYTLARPTPKGSDNSQPDDDVWYCSHPSGQAALPPFVTLATEPQSGPARIPRPPGQDSVVGSTLAPLWKYEIPQRRPITDGFPVYFSSSTQIDIDVSSSFWRF